MKMVTLTRTLESMGDLMLRQKSDDAFVMMFISHHHQQAPRRIP